MQPIPFTQEQLQTINDAITPQVEQKLQEKNKGYIKFSVDKKNGDKRWIHAPHFLVKSAQKVVLSNMPSASVRQNGHEVITGFIPGMSILDNARPHVRKEVILSIDLKNFFPSIPPNRIATALKLTGGFYNNVPTTVTGIEQTNSLFARVLNLVTTSKGRLPQGAPTSPMLANWACVGGDEALVEFCDEHRLTYTRYADDLTFSSYSSIDQDVVDELITLINGYSGNYGVKKVGVFGPGVCVAPKKVKFMRRHKQQRVTGIVVNEKLSIPRARRKQLRAFMHDCEVNGVQEALSRFNRSIHHIFGEFSFLHLAHEKQAETYIEQFKELL